MSTVILTGYYREMSLRMSGNLKGLKRADFPRLSLKKQESVQMRLEQRSIRTKRTRELSFSVKRTLKDWMMMKKQSKRNLKRPSSLRKRRRES